ncbi:MAG TPA: glycosyltransferase family A protein [Thermomonas sp.]|nr:glycosyltransferase family A protein [Thermomonas sp.]
MYQARASWPVILVPVGTNEDALDGCLAALDAGTPHGTRVWLADDAQAGPRGLALIRHWLGTTRLQAAHTRRSQPLGEAAHLQQALQACGNADVVVLASDARPVPGWLTQLAACLASDAAIATATPWCNAGEVAAWPRIGEIVVLPDALGRLADACAHLPADYPPLPSAVAHAVLLRGLARVAAGGVDGVSYQSWYAALIDLSLRMAGLGGRNVLCDNAFVLRDAESAPQTGDLDALAVRWPAWHARLADCLMHDPLLPQRQRLQQALQAAERVPPQPDLFVTP